MTIPSLGWDAYFQKQLDELDDPTLLPARVVIDHGQNHLVLGAHGEQRAQLSGRLTHLQKGAQDRPAVGDWVGVHDIVIDHIFKRKGAFIRQAAGLRTGAQVIAANIDIAFVVTSPNQDFSPRRLERYLIATWDAGASPVVVLNKSDLCDDIAPFLDKIENVATGCSVVTTSGLLADGIDDLKAFLTPGSTGVFVGSSGVGKSTLINAILGREKQATAEARSADDKGRHTTTHRELIMVPGCEATIIDTPGMRELQLWSETPESAGVVQAFDDIEELAGKCRFRDCSHLKEPGCAVRDAVSAERLQSYFKLRREQEFQVQRQDVAGRREQRLAGKKLSTLIKQYKKT